MSWAITKKAINSDLTEPLNYLNYIENVVTAGNEGYVINTESVVNELGSKSKLALNDKIASPLIADAIINYNTAVGGYFANVTDDATGLFDGLNTIEAVANSETAMTAIVNSETAMTAVINSETAMTAIANSETAMEIVFGVGTPNYGIREKIWDNEVASNIIMTTSTSRDWLTLNAQVIYEELTSLTYVLKVAKKGLVLFIQAFGAPFTPAEPCKYRYIQPGDLESAISISFATNPPRIENKRVSTLELAAGHANSDYVNARVGYVQMQE